MSMIIIPTAIVAAMGLIAAVILTIDVYKRQLEGYAEIQEFLKAGRRREDVVSLAEGRRIFPVSYTHLDVYKRQQRHSRPEEHPS